MIESALYTGTLHHARLEGPSHAFSYNVAMAWLALEELPGALDAHPFWSARHPAPMRFRRQDFHGPAGVPLADAVRHTVAEATGRLPTGPVRLLAHLRTWGWSFNPIAFYFVMTPDGQSGTATVTLKPAGDDRYVMLGPERIVGDQREEDFEITVVKPAPSPAK